MPVLRAGIAGMNHAACSLALAPEHLWREYGRRAAIIWNDRGGPNDNRSQQRKGRLIFKERCAEHFCFDS
jgi:hypothetical protein